MAKPMRVCPDCGAWLDSGERCDCKDAITSDAAPEVGDVAGQTVAGNPYIPVFAAGA